MRLGVAFAACVLLAGCTDPTEPRAQSPAETSFAAVLRPYEVLQDSETASLVYNHPVCGLPPDGREHYELERSPGFIVPETRRLQVEYLLGGVWLQGIRVGWSVDGGETEWSALLTPGEGTFDIAVDPAQWEDGQIRWAFVYRPTNDGPSDGCPNGQYVDGGFQITVTGHP